MDDDVTNPLFAAATTLRSHAQAIIEAARLVTRTADQICQQTADLRAQTSRERHPMNTPDQPDRAAVVTN